MYDTPSYKSSVNPHAPAIDTGPSWVLHLGHDVLKIVKIFRRYKTLSGIYDNIHVNEKKKQAINWNIHPYDES